MVAIHFAANQTHAEMYKWKDSNGVIHYSDVPPASEQNVETIKTIAPKIPSTSPATAKPKIDTTLIPEKVSKPKIFNKKKAKITPTPKVEIYTASWCRYCKRAIGFLQSNGIKFRQYDIEKDPGAAAKMKASGGTGGVPFAIINGKRVYGFSEKLYKNALGLP